MLEKSKVIELDKMATEVHWKFETLCANLEKQRKAMFEAFKSIEDLCVECEQFSCDYGDVCVLAEENAYAVKDDEQDENSNDQADTEESANVDETKNVNETENVDEQVNVVNDSEAMVDKEGDKVTGKYKYEPYNWMDRYEYKDAPTDVLYERLAEAAISGLSCITLIAKGTINRFPQRINERFDNPENIRFDTWGNIRMFKDDLNDFFKSHDEVCAILATLEYRNPRIQKALKEFKQLLADNRVKTENHATDDVYSVLEACFLPQWTIVEKFVDACFDVDHYWDLRKLNILSIEYDNADDRLDINAIVDDAQ